MAYLGELYSTEFIKQKGFTDKAPVLNFLDTLNVGDLRRKGDYIYQLVDNVPFLSSDTFNILNINRKTFTQGLLYKDEDIVYVAKDSFPNYHNTHRHNKDNDSIQIIDNVEFFGKCPISEQDREENTIIFTWISYFCDSKQYKYTLTLSNELIDNSYYNILSFIEQKQNCDGDNDGDEIILQKYGRAHIRDRWKTSIFYDELSVDDLVIFKPTAWDSSFEVYRLKDIFSTSNPIYFKQILAPIKIGVVNHLKPFDGYYSVAKCTDYSEVYYKVKVTQNGNVVSLGSLIAEEVTIEQYRDDEKVGEVKVTPDNRQDKDGVLPEIPVTIMGKLNIADGDTLLIKFSGNNVSIGNIETTYMIDDGLTKYAFSVNFIDYNQVKEEFGEIELGNKPIVGRVSLTNIHRFGDAGLLYKRYKNLMKKFVLYDPFDAFVSGKAMDWVVRAYVENAPIKTIGKENEIPETIEVGLSVREII